MYKKEEERRERKLVIDFSDQLLECLSLFLCAVEMQKVAFHFCFFWTISKSARFSFLPHCRAKIWTEKKWPKLEFEEEPKQAVVVVV